LEVAPDWHEPMVPQCIMQLSTVHANRQLHPRTTVQLADTPSPQSATLGLHPIATGELLLIFHPTEGRRLRWPEHIVG